MVNCCSILNGCISYIQWYWFAWNSCFVDENRWYSTKWWILFISWELASSVWLFTINTWEVRQRNINYCTAGCRSSFWPLRYELTHLQKLEVIPACRECSSTIITYLDWILSHIRNRLGLNTQILVWWHWTFNHWNVILNYINTLN